MSVYSFKVKDAVGAEKSLDEYKGKALLIVNTASKCGFTKQYDELEELNKLYKDKGLVILGFPCNQFGSQESGSNDEIQEFCRMSFGVSFPVFGKIEVNGSNTEPLYKWLKDKAPGLLGSKKIKWNFTKFLVSNDGEGVERFAPTTTPLSMKEKIEGLLK